ncbi:hypothetical protein BGW42_000262 [Actinomortierella wolfii]|nr:hypothetical protein BGW42_000262 [Actinomortierella wolfii]
MRIKITKIYPGDSSALIHTVTGTPMRLVYPQPRAPLASYSKTEEGTQFQWRWPALRVGKSLLVRGQLEIVGATSDDSEDTLQLTLTVTQAMDIQNRDGIEYMSIYDLDNDNENLQVDSEISGGGKGSESAEMVNQDKEYDIDLDGDCNIGSDGDRGEVEDGGGDSDEPSNNGDLTFDSSPAPDINDMDQDSEGKAEDTSIGDCESGHSSNSNNNSGIIISRVDEKVVGGSELGSEVSHKGASKYCLNGGGGSTTVSNPSRVNTFWKATHLWSPPITSGSQDGDHSHHLRYPHDDAYQQPSKLIDFTRDVSLHVLKGRTLVHDSINYRKRVFDELVRSSDYLADSSDGDETLHQGRRIVSAAQTSKRTRRRIHHHPRYD